MYIFSLSTEQEPIISKIKNKKIMGVRAIIYYQYIDFGMGPCPSVVGVLEEGGRNTSKTKNLGIGVEIFIPKPSMSHLPISTIYIRSLTPNLNKIYNLY